MKKHILLVTSLILLSLCSTVAEAEAHKFRIWISCPLSGVLAEYGTAVRNGVLLAQSNDPSKFENVEIIFEDSKRDPKTAVQAFHSLHSDGEIFPRCRSGSEEDVL